MSPLARFWRHFWVPRRQYDDLDNRYNSLLAVESENGRLRQEITLLSSDRRLCDAIEQWLDVRGHNDFHR
jgi:hypothetical protein